MIIKVDIVTGEVLVDNLEALWAEHNKNSGLKEPTVYSNPALQVVKKPVHQHLFKRIKQFNKNRKNRWSDQELYRLVELIWLEQQGYKRAAVQLGRSKNACKQMMHCLRKAGVLGA